MRRRLLGVTSLFTLVFALVLAGCGGGGGSSAGKNVTCPDAGSAGTATNGAITVCAFDSLRFGPKTINAPAGPLTVTLVNKGSIQHTFAVDGQNFELKTPGHNDLKT